MTSTIIKKNTESNKATTDLLESHIICLFTLTISTICFLVAIVYQLWSSQKFWEYSPSLSFAIAGVVGYALVFWLIFKSVSKVGSDIMLNWPFLAFLILFLNVVVFSIPGFGISVVGMIIGELIAAGLGFLGYKTWQKYKKST